MSALGTKLVRDIARLKGQVGTIALVLACAFMAMIMLRGTWEAMLDARDAYYQDQRFGDVFAHVERAPDAAAARLEAIPGVVRVYPRLVEKMIVPLPGEPLPISGRVISIPEDGVPPLDGLYLRSGRLPVPGADDEVVLLEQFAEATGITTGDTLPAVLNGKLRQLDVVGVALSPEFVISVPPEGGPADNKRFVVVWMPRRAVARAFQLEGAFDDVVMSIEPGTPIQPLLAAVDRTLAPYGAFHASARDRQLSNFALDGELGQLRTLAIVIPAIFLGVAAFLVNVVVSRLVFLERTQIAILKAVGYPDRRIGLQYLGLVSLIVAIATPVGLLLGVWAGRWMTSVYRDFFRFPSSEFSLHAGTVAFTVGIGLAAAALGALGAVRRVARMPPAQAMRPPSPLGYRRSLVERTGVSRLLGPSAMMVVREIQRRPVRFFLSVIGIAFGVGIFVMGRMSLDSFGYLFDGPFLREHQEDMTVTFASPRPARVLGELEDEPGVLYAEGERMVGARFQVGTRWHDALLVGMPQPSQLRHLLDHGTTPVTPPPDGVLMTDQLAFDLGLAVGDTVDVELIEGARPVRTVRVAGLIDEPFGLQAYAQAGWLSGFLGEEPSVSNALLRVDPDRGDEVIAHLEKMPAVIGVSRTRDMIVEFRARTGSMFTWITLILTLSAAAIATGVIYNNARVALSMRSRDLASLRILGFSRREISSVLLGELGAQVVIGVPLGLVVGNGLARLMVMTVDREYMRFPLHISPITYAAAATVAIASALLSALLVRRKLDRLDLVAVLKSSE